MAVCALAAAACAAESSGPVTVAPADDDQAQADAPNARATDTPATAPSDDGHPDSARPGAGTLAGVHVVDAKGADLGHLFRRGSDDNVADLAIYDLVTVFHAASGLFYEVSTSDGVPRLPVTTFFKGATCDVPVGVSAGGCTDCRAALGVGILHGSTWYSVTPHAPIEQRSVGSTRGSGIDDGCVAHSGFNAKMFPVEPHAGPTPPGAIAGPLRFEVR